MASTLSGADHRRQDGLVLFDHTGKTFAEYQAGRRSGQKGFQPLQHEWWRRQRLCCWQQRRRWQWRLQETVTAAEAAEVGSGYQQHKLQHQPPWQKQQWRHRRRRRRRRRRRQTRCTCGLGAAGERIEFMKLRVPPCFCQRRGTLARGGAPSPAWRCWLLPAAATAWQPAAAWLPGCWCFDQGIRLKVSLQPTRISKTNTKEDNSTRG